MTPRSQCGHLGLVNNRREMSNISAGNVGYILVDQPNPSYTNLELHIIITCLAAITISSLRDSILAAMCTTVIIEHDQTHAIFVIRSLYPIIATPAEHETVSEGGWRPSNHPQCL